MRKIISLLLCLVLAFSLLGTGFAVSAENLFASEAFKYYNSDKTDVRIDGTVAAENVFMASKNLTKLDLGSVQTIEEYAFAQTGIKTLTVPANVTSIAQYAFAECDSLEILDLSAATNISIAKNAFANCSELKLVKLPSTATIGDLAFVNCDKVEIVAYDGTQTTFDNNYKGKIGDYNQEIIQVSQKADFTCTTEFGGNVSYSSINGLVNDAYYGKDVTITATPASGFEFLRWEKNDGSLLSENATYTYAVEKGVNDNVVAFFKSEDDITVTFVVKSNDTAKGTVTASNASNGNAYSIDANDQLQDIYEGASVVLTATATEGNKFAYWVDQNNRVVSEKEEATITKEALRYNYYEAVFVADTKQVQTYTVTVRGGNNRLYTYETAETSVAFSAILSADAEINAAVNAPVEYTFAGGWVIEGDEGNRFGVDDAITTTENPTIRPLYSKITNTYSLTVGQASAVNYEYNTKATAKATADNFTHWEETVTLTDNAEQMTVSYRNEYTFYVNYNRVINEGINGEVLPLINITNVDKRTNGGTNYFEIHSERDIEDKYEIVQAGIIMTKRADVASNELRLENVDGKRIKLGSTRILTNIGQYRVTTPNNGATIRAVAFVVYKDENGATKTVYSNRYSLKGTGGDGMDTDII